MQKNKEEFREDSLTAAVVQRQITSTMRIATMHIRISMLLGFIRGLGLSGILIAIAVTLIVNDDAQEVKDWCVVTEMITAGLIICSLVMRRSLNRSADQGMLMIKNVTDTDTAEA